MYVHFHIDELSIPVMHCFHEKLCVFSSCHSNLPFSHPAIYDVVEEKTDSEPDFQYIPEKSPQDPTQLDQHALRDSMVTLKEGLGSGAILAQFDVRRARNKHAHKPT